MTAEKSAELCKSPHFRRIVDRAIAAQPGQAHMIDAMLADLDSDQFAVVEQLSAHILTLLGDAFDAAMDDYKWVCAQMFKAELMTRRSDSNVNKSFADVLSGIYATDKPDMGRYMRGLLVSQVLWRQHVGPLLAFVDIVKNPEQPFTYLEVGPGHGLWMALAASSSACQSLTGWDVSNESIAQTRKALKALGISKPATFDQCDICTIDATTRKFDTIVASQVLEIVEDPDSALMNLKRSLTDEGRLIINAPVRAAALDHVRRWKSAEEVVTKIEAAGLEVLQTRSFGARTKEIRPDEGFSLFVQARNRGVNA